MARPPLAEPSDLADLIPGGIDDDEEPRAAAALRSASAWARAEAHQTWVDEAGNLAVPDDHEIAVEIVLAVAKRVFDNPDGIILSVVDGATEQTANPSADTYLTGGERLQLRRLRPSARRGVGTLPTTRGIDDLATTVPVTGYAPPDELGADTRGAKPMPWSTGPDLF